MGKQWKQWLTLYFWAPKSLQMVIVAMKLKDTCSLEEKLWQTRQHIWKQRHYFTDRVHLVQAMVVPVVMYGCESWTIKKAERRRIEAFELWCWRRLLRVPWTARRSNQFILKEIREVGGGFMFGNACIPVVDSCQCMAKPIQYCKVK